MNVDSHLAQPTPPQKSKKHIGRFSRRIQQVTYEVHELDMTCVGTYDCIYIYKYYVYMQIVT